MKATQYVAQLNKLVLNLKISDQNQKQFDFDDGIENITKTLRTIENGNSQIMVIGNGGSAAIASHTSIDLLKNTGIRSTCFNESALLTCLSNDFGYEQVFVKPIEIFADNESVLIAISSSGQSKNIINAVEKARSLGCKIITFSGFKSNNPLRKLGDFNVFISSFEYGYVELSHQIVLHCITDKIMKIKSNGIN